MSDEEYEYDYGSDAEYDYGSDQENGDNDGNNAIIEIENSFYEGEDLKQSKPLDAIAMFEKVVELEKRHGDIIKW